MYTLKYNPLMTLPLWFWIWL